MTSDLPEEGSELTIIGRAVAIEEGRLVVARDLVIHGKVLADVSAGGRVLVAEGAVVVGKINAQSLVVAGDVNGDVTATDLFELRKGGRLEGSVSATKFSVEPGASGLFNLSMGDELTEQDIQRLRNRQLDYERALKQVSELTGREHLPSTVYSALVRNRTQSDSETQVSNEEKDASDGETDWPEPTSDEIADRKRFATESAVGKLAWSKSVKDHIVRRKAEDNLAVELQDLTLGSGSGSDMNPDAPATDASRDTEKSRSREVKNLYKETGANDSRSAGKVTPDSTAQASKSEAYLSADELLDTPQGLETLEKLAQLGKKGGISSVDGVAKSRTDTSGSGLGASDLF